MQAIRLLVADDQQLMREGLRTLLELEEGMTVVGEAGDGEEAVRAFNRLLPDVVLMDIRMPNVNGIEATRRILAKYPDAKILVLTTFDEDELVEEAVRVGARGYLLKDLSGKDLSAAVGSVARGDAALEPSIARKVMEALARTSLSAPKPKGQLLEPLSDREQSVLNLLAKGLSNKEIADKLFLAEGTVKNHVTAILQKVGVRDRIQAVLRARDMGLIQ